MVINLWRHSTMLIVSDNSHMEYDPGASWNMVTEKSTRRYEDFTHPAFVKKLHLQILPNDVE